MIVNQALGFDSGLDIVRAAQRHTPCDVPIRVKDIGPIFQQRATEMRGFSSEKQACLAVNSVGGALLALHVVFGTRCVTGTRPTTRRVPACRELVLKFGHSLQLILGGVIHRVIGIPTVTGADCGSRRGGSCGTGGGFRGGVSSGSSCRRIRRCGRC
jgi:hypothetical protein